MINCTRINGFARKLKAEGEDISQTKIVKGGDKEMLFL